MVVAVVTKRLEVRNRNLCEVAICEIWFDTKNLRVPLVIFW